MHDTSKNHLLLQRPTQLAIWVICSIGQGLRKLEVNRNLEADTKIATVSELLEILDDLERGASQASRVDGVMWCWKGRWAHRLRCPV